MSTRGGCESYYFRMANALAARGHHVHIITQSGPERSFCDGLNPLVQVHALDFKEEPFKGSWLFDSILPLSYFRYSKLASRKLRDLLEEYRIDVVQVPDWTLEGFHVVWNKQRPVFLRLHGIANYQDLYDLNSDRTDLRKWAMKMISRHILTKADYIHSVSSDYSAKAGQLIGHQRKIHVLPNGIDQEIYRPKPDGQSREKIILFAGRLHVSKGIEIAAKAVPLVLKEFPDFKFVFAGKENPKNQEWKDILISQGFQDNLLFLGSLASTDLVRYYQKSTMGIFPSLYEAGGAALLEAMACGCPVIATKVGGFLESIEDGVDGLLIPPDSLALAAAIKRLIVDEKLRNTISTNAVEKISEHFSLNKAVEETMAAYQRA